MRLLCGQPAISVTGHYYNIVYKGRWTFLSNASTRYTADIHTLHIICMSHVIHTYKHRVVCTQSILYYIQAHCI